MTVFQKEELLKTNELERDMNGLIQKDTRRKTFRDRSVKIEYFSRQLAENRINLKRFLKMMINMDNKIVFNEHEYPVLEKDEIEFESIDDLKQYEQILKEPVIEAIETQPVIDTSPIILNTTTVGSAVHVVTNEEEPLRKGRSKKPPNKSVLTRSQTRKLACSNQEQGASTSTAKRNVTQQSSVLTRLGKRRLDENSRDENRPCA